MTRNTLDDRPRPVHLRAALVALAAAAGAALAFRHGESPPDNGPQAAARALLHAWCCTRGAPPTTLCTRRIDINRAPVSQLELLPRVGPALARRIAAHRAVTPFEKPDDLIAVRGIGPATARVLAPLVCFEGCAPVCTDNPR